MHEKYFQCIIYYIFVQGKFYIKERGVLENIIESDFKIIISCYVTLHDNGFVPLTFWNTSTLFSFS